MRESEYQKHLIRDLKRRFPGAIVLKNDPNYIQGIPDLTVLCDGFWAMLEVKRSRAASKRVNQQWYIDKASDMSFGAIISPDTHEEILDEMERSFEARRVSRLP